MFALISYRLQGASLETINTWFRSNDILFGMFCWLCNDCSTNSLGEQTSRHEAGGPKNLFLSINCYESDEPQNVMDLRTMLKHALVTFRLNREKVIPQKITLVNVKNNFRKTIARRVISVYAGDILIDALKQELKAAGYTVRLVHKLPKNAEN